MSPELKNSVEGIFSAIGLNPSQAIVLFYKQVELSGGLPFEVRIPQSKLVDMSTLSKEAFDAELERGYSSAVCNRVRSVKSARAAFRRKHGV
jgi:addiction module RelB/DinJ family antitoxin